MDNGIENMLQVSEKRGQFTTEANFEKYICDTIIKKHLDGMHFKLTGYKGVPDRLVLPHHFIEFKIVMHSTKGGVPLHKGWTIAQRQWAKAVHAQGAKAWFCALLQNTDNYEKNVYLEPAIWSLWAHEGNSYRVRTYYKHQLLVPSKTELVKDHVWERLETDYYDQSVAKAGEAAFVGTSGHKTKGSTKRLAP